MKVPASQVQVGVCVVIYDNNHDFVTGPVIGVQHYRNSQRILLDIQVGDTVKSKMIHKSRSVTVIRDLVMIGLPMVAPIGSR